MLRIPKILCLAAVLTLAVGVVQANGLLDAASHPKFVNPVPNPLAPGFIYQPVPVASWPAGVPADCDEYYEVGMYPILQPLGLVDSLGDPLLTALWGYGTGPGFPAATFPGRTFVVRGDGNKVSNLKTCVQWTNNLVDGMGEPLLHLLPVDSTLHWAFSLPGYDFSDYTVTVPDNPIPGILRPDPIDPVVDFALSGGLEFDDDDSDSDSDDDFDPSVRRRKLLLFEGIDQFGRLQPMLGVAEPTEDADGNIVDGTLLWDDHLYPITENPMLDDVEVWEVYNSTADAHPIHLHLVAFQMLGRQRFKADVFEKEMEAHDGSTSIGGFLTSIRNIGQLKPPLAMEAGWKDTAIMYPGEVTRFIARFDRPGRYVWHCHILSHEDHEMMRPYHVGLIP